MTPQVDLVLPGLFNLADLDAGNVELPALYSMLRFGQPNANALISFDAIVADCLAISHITFASAFAEDNGMLCRAVHLKPDMGGALAIPLDQNDDDISIIINDLSDYFKEDSNFCDLGGGLWMMHLKQIQPPAELPHYLSILGRKLDQSTTTLVWSRLINEMQMFMHAHAINQRRLQNGQLAINSLWCWGAGEYQPPQRRYSSWYCDNVELSAYGRKDDIDCFPLDTLVDKRLVGDTLIVELKLLQALKSSATVDLPALLESLEFDLFKPLCKTVKAGRINLCLRVGHKSDFLLSRSSMFKFWRKPVTLTSLK
ncbi:MAG: hypothetical protein GY820_35325 [Gammaproteobacteria bacterium]|nr:hypothetical protein [Gammaproteobacteria bacterium]